MRGRGNVGDLPYFCTPVAGFEIYAEVAQLVERNLAKVEVAGSSLVFRSRNSIGGLPVEFFIFGLSLVGW
jgi:hypothetical protein